VAGTPKDPDSTIEALMYFLQESLYYGAKITTWHTVEHMLKTAVAAGVGVLLAGSLSKMFKSGVDSESVVEAETYFEFSGKRNKETATGNELVNQIIHTQSTYSLSK